jgi:MarR family transcriptional regulator, lower aerobic nicotinate degradation pathway regulator
MLKISMDDIEAACESEVPANASEVCPRMEAIANSAFGRSAFHLIMRAASLVRLSVVERLASQGISARQLAVLDALAEIGPLTQQEVGALLAIDRTTVVALIDGLEADGLVVREPHPNDRRAYALTLTDRGRTVTAGSLRILVEAESQFLAPLNQVESDQFRSYLRRLATDPNDSPGHDVPGADEAHCDGSAGTGF